MILYPTIELLDGHCVSLHRGRLAEPLVWHVDPVATAQGFAQAGAEWMHLTDFDAVQGNERHAELIGAVLRGAGIPVQLAGGMRTRERVAHWLDQGAGRVVVGTLATQDPDAVKELAKRFPDQIVLAIDLYQGQVMGDGWRVPTALAADAFIAAFDGVPLAAIKITDIDNDIADGERSMALISELAGLTRTPVIASGVVRDADDIARLKYIPNIAGALVGRALFNKSVSIDAALAAARPEPEPVAPFI